MMLPGQFIFHQMRGMPVAESHACPATGAFGWVDEGVPVFLHGDGMCGAVQDAGPAADTLCFIDVSFHGFSFLRKGLPH